MVSNFPWKAQGLVTESTEFMGKWRFFKQDGDKLEGKVKYVLAEAKNPVLIQM